MDAARLGKLVPEMKSSDLLQRHAVVWILRSRRVARQCAWCRDLSGSRPTTYKWCMSSRDGRAIPVAAFERPASDLRGVFAAFRGRCARVPNPARPLLANSRWLDPFLG